MARTISGVVNVPNNGNRVQISAVDERVLTITFLALVGNTGAVYLGDITVTVSTGLPFQPGDTFSDDPSQGTQDTDITHTTPLNGYYIDSDNDNDKMAYHAQVV